MTPLELLKHHVTGAIERGEAQPIVVQPAPSALPKRMQEYTGPFPRKRHSHRCLNCGGNGVACYKSQCTLAPVVTRCRWCR